MNPILKVILGLAGVPDQDVADLEKDQPELVRLIAASKQLQTIFARNQPLESHIQQATPIIQKAYPDFVVVLPTAQELLQLAVQKGI